MRKFLIPAAAAAFLAISPMAMASTTTEGTIKAVDMTAMTVTLDCGTVYKLPAGFKDALKPGEKIMIVWDMKNSVHQADNLTVLK